MTVEIGGGPLRLPQVYCKWITYLRTPTESISSVLGGLSQLANETRSRIFYKPRSLHLVNDLRGFETWLKGPIVDHCAPSATLHPTWSDLFTYSIRPIRWFPDSIKIFLAMTRTEPVSSNASWETKSIATTDDGNRMDSVGQDPRPRGRIRRSMTACNTCRKLKTRCDLDPRGHACRRCLSLRFVLFSLFFVYAPYSFNFSGSHEI